ncbi:hypothetical protein ACFOGJ_28410 [Marinibaculum pumilum]|uniref:Uncharacterized protein n=1 Tax=Marinibaculum pumilum TaxID=1766165 RepID=A0ABV7L9Q1_9PROT
MSDNSKRKESDKVDEELEETFPASDPPSYMPGHAGEPRPAKDKARKDSGSKDKGGKG